MKKRFIITHIDSDIVTIKGQSEMDLVYELFTNTDSSGLFTALESYYVHEKMDLLFNDYDSGIDYADTPNRNIFLDKFKFKTLSVFIKHLLVEHPYLSIEEN